MCHGHTLSRDSGERPRFYMAFVKHVGYPEAVFGSFLCGYISMGGIVLVHMVYPIHVMVSLGVRDDLSKFIDHPSSSNVSINIVL